MCQYCPGRPDQTERTNEWSCYTASTHKGSVTRRRIHEPGTAGRLMKTTTCNLPPSTVWQTDIITQETKLTLSGMARFQRDPLSLLVSISTIKESKSAGQHATHLRVDCGCRIPESVKSPYSSSYFPIWDHDGGVMWYDNIGRGITKDVPPKEQP